MTYRIRLDAQQHSAFLAERRKDPITKELLRAGTDIVICATDKIAFIAENWSGQCPFCHGTDTLSYIPTNNFPSHLGRSSSPPRIPRIPTPVPVYAPTPTPTFQITDSRMGFWRTLFLISFFGGGMGWLLANNSLQFIWQNLILGNTVYWSIALTVYTLTRRPMAAFFTQALMMILMFRFDLKFENIFLVLLISIVLSSTLARLTRDRVVSVFILAIPTICAEITYDLYGTIAWKWEWSNDVIISLIVGAALAAPVAVVIGKIFKRY